MKKTLRRKMRLCAVLLSVGLLLSVRPELIAASQVDGGEPLKTEQTSSKSGQENTTAPKEGKSPGTEAKTQDDSKQDDSGKEPREETVEAADSKTDKQKEDENGGQSEEGRPFEKSGETDGKSEKEAGEEDAAGDREKAAEDADENTAEDVGEVKEDKAPESGTQTGEKEDKAPESSTQTDKKEDKAPESDTQSDGSETAAPAAVPSEGEDTGMGSDGSAGAPPTEEDKVGEGEEEEAGRSSLTEDAEVPLQSAPRKSLKTTPPLRSGIGDVYIDNTTDSSVSYVTGMVHLTGSAGTQAGYDPGKTIYTNSANVTYSNPRPSMVQGLINDAYTIVYNTANRIKNSGRTGEFHMSTSQSTGKVWDNRIYKTLSLAVVSGPGITDPVEVTYDGSTGTYQDAAGKVYSPDEYQFMRTHIASGDYGKETFFRVEANGWVSGYGVTVTDDGQGTASSDAEPEGDSGVMGSMAGATVTVTATPSEGHQFKRWEVISGSVTLDDETAATTTFTMPAGAVEVKAIFEPTHTHDLTGTAGADPTCVKPGTKAYWTCSDCGRIFADESGKTEISEPETLAALGHSWGDWVITKEATAEAEGERQRTCGRCGEVETETIPRIAAEKYGSGNEKDDSGQEKDKENGVLQDREVPDEELSGDKKPDEDPPAGSTVSTGSKAGSSTGGKAGSSTGTRTKSPKTGDESDILLWTALAFGAAAVLAIAVGLLRRKDG